MHCTRVVEFASREARAAGAQSLKVVAAQAQLLNQKSHMDNMDIKSASRFGGHHAARPRATGAFLVLKKQ